MRFETNGGKKYKLHCSESNGHAMFHPENLLDLGPQYYAHLCNFFNDWLNKHPERTIRATLPICDGSGQTVILHVWWD